MNKGYAGISLESPDTGIGLSAGWHGGLPPVELGNFFAGPFAGRSTYTRNPVVQNGQTGGYNVYIGYQAAMSSTVADANVSIGYQAGPANAPFGEGIYIGYQAGMTDNAGANIYIGYQAGAFSKTGQSNVIIGGGSASGTSFTASNLVVIGSGAGVALTSAASSVMIGANAGAGITGGSANVVIGYNSADLHTFSNGTFLGYQAGASNSGNNNVGIGTSAGQSLAAGINNVYLGYQSGFSPNASSSGSQQTCIGANTGLASATQFSYITCLGYGTTVGANGGVAIGVDSGGISATTSVGNQIALGTANHAVLIAGKLTVGTANITGFSSAGHLALNAPLVANTPKDVIDTGTLPIGVYRIAFYSTTLIVDSGAGCAAQMVLKSGTATMEGKLGASNYAAAANVQQELVLEAIVTVTVAAIIELEIQCSGGSGGTALASSTWANLAITNQTGFTVDQIS